MNAARKPNEAERVELVVPCEDGSLLVCASNAADEVAPPPREVPWDRILDVCRNVETRLLEEHKKRDLPTRVVSVRTVDEDQTYWSTTRQRLMRHRR